MRAPPALPATPDRARLHDAAIRHLARYATTSAGLLRVLSRRIDRWARATEAEPEAVLAARAVAQGVVDALASAGLVNDAEFAAARARSLTRSGRSRRAVTAHLAQRGVGPDILEAAVPDDAEAELAAAVLLARKRRLGPFGATATDAEARHKAMHKALAAFARAGFSQDTARKALAMEADAAEALIIRLRRD